MSELRATAIRLLARREHTQHELSVKLEMRGFSRVEINTLISSLAEQGIQSDARFATQYAHSRFEKGYGENAIKQALLVRHLPETLIQEVLSHYSPAMWIERARRVLYKRFGKICKQNTDFVQRAQYLKFLQYRGFLFEYAEAALRE